MLSLVSFLAALLRLPPFSDRGLVVMENSVELSAPVLAFWFLSGRPGPGSGGFGSFCLLGGSPINWG